MILNKLYRLKRKKGAVLFVVIAMMTLLVIMATAAYYTARSSHQTVINNYDFSQLYLSAVSVSDMVVDAVTNDTVDNTSGRNKFSDLQKAILDKSFTVGKRITAKSDKITSSMTTAEQILTQTASDPQIAGVLDAVQIVISHEANELVSETKDSKEYIDYFLFTTTAYYRNNTITIQDRIGLQKIEPKEGDLFTTFFTATGQNITGGVPGPDPSRLVVINTKEISDDAFFENKYTVFKENGLVSGGTGNYFTGGLSAAGSVWLEEFKGNVPAATSTTRNDWHINKSLIIGGGSPISMDLKNNNLVIGGDLIITKQMNSITAENIIVKGNIIDLSGTGQVALKGNLYVEGTILSNLTEYENDTDYVKGAKRKARELLNDMNGRYQDVVKNVLNKTEAESKSYNLDGYMKKEWRPVEKTTPITGDGKTASGSDTSTAYVKINDCTSVHINHAGEISSTNLQNIKNGATVDIGTWSEADLQGKIWTQNRKVNSSNTGYEYSASNTTTDSALSSTSSSTPYKTYSASDKTMKQTLTISFDKNNSAVYTAEVNAEGKPTGKYNGTFQISGVSGAADATVEIDTTKDNGKITVNLPYCDDGYVLDLNFKNTDYKHESIDYFVQSSNDEEKPFPVVLKANYDDGSGLTTDYADNNAFSWNVDGGKNNDTNGGDTNVFIQGSGDVIFEVGNYYTKGDKNQHTYDYFMLNRDMATPTYHTLQKLRIGTKAQLDKISYGNDKANAQSCLTNGGKGPDLQTAYDNQVIIVSNKIGGVAFEDARANTLLCGYLYAPFSTYFNASSQGEGTPQLGGMIVSDYVTEFSNFIYAEPDPKLISNLGKSLSNIDNKTAVNSVKWIVKDSSKGLGSNFIG